MELIYITFVLVSMLVSEIIAGKEWYIGAAIAAIVVALFLVWKNSNSREPF